SGPPGGLPAVRDALDSIADAFLPVSAPVADALPDLLALAEESVTATRHRLATNLAATRTLLDDTGYRVRRCEGGWTVVIDVPRHVAFEGLAEQLLRDAHLAVHPGWFYDMAGDGALALSLLPEPAAFADGIRRLKQAVDALAHEAS